MKKFEATKLLEAVDPDSLYFEIHEREIDKEEAFTRKDAVEILDWIADQLVDEEDSDEDKANVLYDTPESSQFSGRFVPVYEPDPRD